MALISRALPDTYLDDCQFLRCVLLDRGWLGGGQVLGEDRVGGPGLIRPGQYFEIFLGARRRFAGLNGGLLSDPVMMASAASSRVNGRAA